MLPPLARVALSLSVLAWTAPVAAADLGCAEVPASVSGSTFSASGAFGASVPVQAFDGSQSTVWNAGGPPPQWIQVDLPAAIPLTRVRLAVEQSPAGATRHVVSASTSGVQARDVGAFAGDSSAGQWLEVSVYHRAQTVRVTTTASPSWVAWQEVQLEQDATIAPRYFGYYCSGCSWVGNGNYTAATADHANLVWIADNPVDKVTSRIVEASGHGMKSVVSLTSVFFAGSQLAAGWEAAWGAWAAALAPHEADIAAFYPMDEPDLQGVSDATLTTAIAAIHGRFPSIPVAVIYSPLTVGSGNRPGLAAYDWVGIDCYSAGGYQCEGTPYEDAYYALRSLLDPSRQRTFLVPQAGLPVGTAATAADALAVEIDRYLALARRDLLVVAIVPFLYQSFNDGAANWNGLEAYPVLRAKFAAVGLAVQSEHAAAAAPCQPLPPDAGVPPDAASAPPDAGLPPDTADAAAPGSDAALARPDAGAAGRDAAVRRDAALAAGEDAEEPGPDAGGGEPEADAAAAGADVSTARADGAWRPVQAPSGCGGCGASGAGTAVPLLALAVVAALGRRGRRLPRHRA